MAPKHTPTSLNTALLRMVAIPAGIMLAILAGVSIFNARLVFLDVQVGQSLLIQAIARQGSQYLNETATLMNGLGALVLKLPPASSPVILEQANRNYPRFTTLYLLDENGKVLLEDKPADIQSLLNLDLSGELYFKEAKNLGDTFFSDTFFSIATNDLAVTVAQPLYKNDVFTGMLVAEMNLRDLQETIQRISGSQNDIVFIVDDRATLVAHPNHELVREQVNLGNLPVVRRGLEEPIYGIYRDMLSDEWVLGSAAPMQNGWAVVTTRPVMVVFRPFFTLLGVSLVALALGFLVFGWGTWNSMRRISAPITKLAEKAEQISFGKQASLGNIETQGSYRELVALVNSFEQMLSTIQVRSAELIESNQKLEAELEERHKIEAALRESEIRYRRLFDDSPVAILEEDFSEVNRHFEKLKAKYHDNWEQALAENPNLIQDCISKIEVLSVNRTTLRLHKTKSKQEMLQNRAQVLASHQSFPAELQAIWHKKNHVELEDSLETIDGDTRYVLIKWSAIPNRKIPYDRVLVSLIDITDRKQAESELQRHREHLEELVAERTGALQQANAELESFAYTVSHDLRAPLRHINGFSGILLADFSKHLSQEAHSYLENIQRGAENMTRMIDGLLQLSRATRGELSLGSIDLSQLALEISRELSSSDPGRQVQWKIYSDCMVSGDIRLLRVVLQNLLGNSWKFTALREQALIEFGMLSPEAALQEGFQAHETFFVRDNGAGFDMRYADKLFTPFQRLHSEAEFPGTGIGLATVERIIKKHGGRIWVQSEPNQGTTVYFTLLNQTKEARVN